MSTTFSPELELPSAKSVQITAREVAPYQVTPQDETYFPNSVTYDTEAEAERPVLGPAFGTHIREAVSIFKDWIAE